MTDKVDYVWSEYWQGNVHVIYRDQNEGSDLESISATFYVIAANDHDAIITGSVLLQDIVRKIEENEEHEDDA